MRIAFAVAGFALLSQTAPGIAQQTCSARCPNGSTSEPYNCDGDYVPMCLRAGPVAPPVYVDPRIARARELNELGRAAFDKRDFEGASNYFGQANVVHPDDVYRRNFNLANASPHFQRGLDAFAKRNWGLAIAEFQRGLAFGDDTAVSENIRRAHSYQSWDFGLAALKAGNFDLAIVYFRTAESWWHDPALAGLIRGANGSKFEAQAIAAMNVGNFVAAESLFSRELGYVPDSKYAQSRRADAITEQARAIATPGNLDAAIAAFDRAFQSYDAARAANGGDKSFLNNYRWARETASVLLARLAESNADWEKIVAAHRRWLLSSGSDPDAAHALSQVTAARAGQAIDRGDTRRDIEIARNAAQESLRADPGNAFAGRLEKFTQEQHDRAVETSSIVSAMNASAADAGTKSWFARKQAALALAATPQGAKYESRCPWDSGGKACPTVDNAVVPALPQADGFLPPGQETAEQRTLHDQIRKSDAKIAQLSQKLSKTDDPIERVAIKQQIITAKSNVDADKEKYDVITKAHKIKKRGGAQ